MDPVQPAEAQASPPITCAAGLVRKLHGGTNWVCRPAPTALSGAAVQRSLAAWALNAQYQALLSVRAAAAYGDNPAPTRRERPAL